MEGHPLIMGIVHGLSAKAWKVFVMCMKRLLFTIIMLTGTFTAMADEGMWLPSLIGQRIGDMQAKGFRLSAEDIYNINEASLKDAVVLFGRGCTGELVSAEGLLLTNHHCGYGQIQKHSSVEHDDLRDRGSFSTICSMKHKS